MREYRLYHSFPRGFKTSPEEEERIGLATLDSMARIGLVLTPEITEWAESMDDGTHRPMYAMTRRISFTYLPEDELVQHAETFGRFSVEWEVSALRKLGAMPVLYVPRSGGTPTNDYAGTTETMLARLADVQAVVEFIRDQPNIDITGVRPMDELVGAIQAFAGLFAQTEPECGDALSYYGEREWRIVAGARHHALGELTSDLTTTEMQEIADINPTFFRKVVEFRSGRQQRIAQCKVCRDFGGKPVLSTARRVIVPKSCTEAARMILDDAGLEELPVVDLAETP